MKPNEAVLACHLSTGEVETGGFPGPADQPACQVVSPGFNERPVSKKQKTQTKINQKKKKVEGDHRRHSVLHVASIATLLTCTPICTCTHMQSHMHMNTTSTFVDIIQVLKIRHQRVNLWWG